MGAAEVEDNRKDSCSHRDASASGVGELRKTSNSGVHGSIFRSASLRFGKDSRDAAGRETRPAKLNVL